MAKQGKAPQPEAARVPTLAAHPRAARDLLRARGWGALVGFALVAYFASGAGLPVTDVLLRGLVGGVVGMLAGWAACVAVWRAIASAEIRAKERAWLAEREARAEGRDGRAVAA